MPAIAWCDSKYSTETDERDAEVVIQQIREGEWKGWIDDVRAKKKDKTSLPLILWSGTFKYRANDGLIMHSGLLCADLDKINGDLHEVRSRLLNSPHLWALFTSPSGNGLKAIFRVPADASRHAGSFRAIEKHVQELAGWAIDQSCKDVARPCFVT